MPTTEELFQDLARSVEAEIAPRLHGLFGGMLRAYLPQVWEFRTEDGVHVLSVAPDGRTSAGPGPAGAPDVTVEAPAAALRAALLERRKDAVPRGGWKVTAHSAKGRTAFGLLRSRLGL